MNKITHARVDNKLYSTTKKIQKIRKMLSIAAIPMLIALVMGVILGSYATLSVQYVYANYQLVSPIQKKILSPLPTEKVVISTPPPTVTPKKSSIRGKVTMSDMDIAEYISSRGWDYSTAIRVAKSENYWNLTRSFDCSRTNTNTDGSIDVGIFQINSIHTERLTSLGMTMEDMKDCKKNIDYAYKWVYSYSGWTPWSAYTNGSYLSHNDTL